MSNFERPKTAQEAVLVELRQQLLDGRLAPGSAVRPDAIGADLGVSAVPVREALRILEGEGHVSYRPHRGYIVAELDLNDLTEIYRIRALLENEAVVEAIPRLTSADLTHLDDLLNAMETVEEDPHELTAVNRQFHFTLFESAEMPQLVRMLRILWDSSDRYRSRYLLSQENRRLVNEQHRRIMTAIRAGDAETVLDEMQQHREHAVQALASSDAVNAAV